MKEYIIRMLEYANELDLIYHFVLHLIKWNEIPEKGDGDNAEAQGKR